MCRYVELGSYASSLLENLIWGAYIGLPYPNVVVTFVLWAFLRSGLLLVSGEFSS